MSFVDVRTMASELGITDDRMRRWLAERRRNGDERLTTHTPGTRWRLSRDIADSLQRRYLADRGYELEFARGPHGWSNWQALLSGRPARDSTGEGIIMRPSWTEYPLYSDALFTDSSDAPGFRLGPYRLEPTRISGRSSSGRARPRLLLRAYDHLPEPDSSGLDLSAEFTDSYFGGDLSDEMAALIALALSRRVRSGGEVRRAFSGHDPAGEPWMVRFGPPRLSPPRAAPMLPDVEAETDLRDMIGLLDVYPRIAAEDAIVLVRAARQYADALWVADEEPRLAWLRLVAATEAAANRWKSAQFEDSVAQLKRHRPRVHRALRDGPPEVLRRVADDLAPTFNAERKFLQFLKEFDPGPPAVRPPISSRLEWADLQGCLQVVYEMRSRELHAGLAIPAPLLEPPPLDGDVACERLAFLGSSSLGGSWPAERLPMQLHVFAHIVGGAMRAWWRSLAQEGAPEPDGP